MVNNNTQNIFTELPYFEHLCVDYKGGCANKTLIVSFPGRKCNRRADAPQDEKPFLWKQLIASNADVLFVRSVYDGDYNMANITRDYELLPNFLFNLKRSNRIDRLVVFGFSLGCGPCLWLARQSFVDEAVIISPGMYSLPTLMAMDDLRWQSDFEKVRVGMAPSIKQYERSEKIKIIHGLDLEPDRLQEKDLIEYLKKLAPDAVLHGVSGVGHYVPQFWQDKGVLQTKLFDALGVGVGNMDCRNGLSQKWAAIDDTLVSGACNAINPIIFNCAGRFANA